jgi:hypothetical protein
VKVRAMQLLGCLPEPHKPQTLMLPSHSHSGLKVKGIPSGYTSFLDVTGVRLQWLLPTVLIGSAIYLLCVTTR